MIKNEENPLVSVVMATYSGDDPSQLRESIQSILQQTYRNLELIIVLNGRIDAVSKNFIIKLAARDNRVRVIELVINFGPSRARNEGVGLAQGAYIAIMDADDIAAPDRIERQYAFLGETGADLAGSFYYIIDSRGKVIGKKEVPLTPEDIRHWMHVFSPLSHPTVLARADVLRKNPYDERFSCSEDYNLWVRLVRAGYHIRNQPEYLFYYRQEEDFIRKRKGWTFFISDLKNKMLVLSLHPFYKRPLIFFVSMLTVFSRLMPAGLLKLIYAARNRLRFNR